MFPKSQNGFVEEKRALREAWGLTKAIPFNILRLNIQNSSI
jgi:hypothetical protein